MNNTWKLNRDGSLANFYRYFYAKETLPKNGCDYFWLICLAFVLIPFVWPAVFLNMWNKKIVLRESYKWVSDEEPNVPYTYYTLFSSGFVQTAMGSILNIVLIIVGGLIIGPLYKSHPDLFIFHIFSFTVEIILLCALGFITLLIGYLAIINIFKLISSMLPKGPQTEEEWNEYYAKQREKDKIENARQLEKQAHPNFFKLIIMRFMSYKEKNCPLIEWEETKTAK